MTLPAGVLARFEATVGVTAPGGAVSAWADQSGNGHDAAQATTINQPLLSTDYLGRPVVKFSVAPTAANSSSLALASAFTFNARAVSVFMAARVPYASNGTLFGLNNYAGSSGHLRFAATGGNPQTLYSGGQNSTIKPHMLPTVLGTVNGSTTALYLGSEGHTGLGGVTADADCLGATLGRYNTGSYQTMDVYEVVVYDRALTGAEADEVRAHLAAKYATRTTAFTKNVVFEGDSITQGTGTINQRGYPSLVLRAGLEDWRQTNVGSSGANLATLTDRAAATDAMLHAGADRNVLMVLIGRNDAGVSGATGASIYSTLVGYVQPRVAAGWEVWVGTPIATGASLDPILSDLAALIRAGIVTDAGASRVVDFRSLPQYDAAADSASTTYYQGDNTHPTLAGAQLMADMVAPLLADGTASPPSGTAQSIKNLVRVGGTLRRIVRAA